MGCSDIRYRIIPCSHFEDQLFWKNKYKVIQFPCGHCADCTKARQNDIAVRAAYEAMKYSDISFCRLSYRDEALPLSFVPYMCLSDGTKVQDGRSELITDSAFLKDMREAMSKVPNSIIKGKSRYIHYVVEQFNDIIEPGSYIEYLITPSVNISDPRLWLKACRVAFKRQFGYAMPEFKYLMCAEYGSQYTRPHYHYLFLGLKPWIVDWMLKRWETRYGYTTRKTVRNDSKDKFRVASYISKYMAKGDFEAPAVTAGIALKGRYCASRYLGRDVIVNKRSHFLAFDLFGVYDPDSLYCSRLKRTLTDSEVGLLIDSIIDRMSVSVPGADYRLPLPKSWKYLMYYKQVPYKVVSTQLIKDEFNNHLKVKYLDSTRYVPFKIYRLVQKTLQDRSSSDDLRQLQKFIVSLPPGTSYAEANFRFKNFKEVRRASSESHSKEALRSFYSKDSQ